MAVASKVMPQAVCGRDGVRHDCQGAGWDCTWVVGVLVWECQVPSARVLLDGSICIMRGTTQLDLHIGEACVWAHTVTVSEQQLHMVGRMLLNIELCMGAVCCHRYLHMLRYPPARVYKLQTLYAMCIVSAWALLCS